MAESYPARDIWGMFPTTFVLEEKRSETMEAPAAYFGQAQQGQMLGQASYPARDIWNMIPTTLVLEEKRSETMEAPAAYFGQAQQGQMLGQLTQPQPYYQQYVPIGLETRWEIEERKKDTWLPRIEYGGIQMGESVPIVVPVADEIERRYGLYQRGPFMGQVPIRVPSVTEEDKPYGIMQSNAFAGINLRPLGLEGRQVPLRMGQFEAVPMSEGEVAAGQPYAMVNPLALAYTTGAYIRAGAPEWGRFPVMPPGITYRV
jgi:hypothetical protein